MTAKRIFGSGAAAAALGASILAGCAKKTPPPATPARPVKVVTSISQNVPRYIDSFGNLAALNNVDIKSQVAGKILSAHFREGDEVKQSALLFSVDPQEYQAALDKAEAALAVDQANLKLKRETLERNRQLFNQKLISQQDYDTYESAVAQAAAQVKLDQAAVEEASINLRYCSIVSPVDGITGKRLVDPGNIVPSNTGPALVNIKTIDPLYVDFTIPERQFSWVKKNFGGAPLTVEVRPEGEEDGPATNGTLQSIDNTVDNQTGTVSLRAVVSNEKRSLWPGQFVDVKLIVEIAKDAVLVPGGAVQLGQKGMYLFVVGKDNRAELRDEIEVGQVEAGNVVIEKGVSAGEQIVVSGQLGLANGSLVTVLPEGEESKK